MIPIEPIEPTQFFSRGYMRVLNLDHQIIQLRIVGVSFDSLWLEEHLKDFNIHWRGFPYGFHVKLKEK